MEHAAEVSEIIDTPEICGEVANVSCVRDQVRSPTASRRRMEDRRCSPYPSNEPMEFCGRIVGDLVRSKLAAPRHHLMGSKPDTQVHELNKPAAVCPPHEAKLLDDEQTKPSVGLFRCAFRIRLQSCGLTGVARTGIGCPLFP